MTTRKTVTFPCAASAELQTDCGSTPALRLTPLLLWLEAWFCCGSKPALRLTPLLMYSTLVCEKKDSKTYSNHSTSLQRAVGCFYNCWGAEHASSTDLRCCASNWTYSTVSAWGAPKHTHYANPRCPLILI